MPDLSFRSYLHGAYIPLKLGLIVYRILKIQRKLKRRNTMVLDSPLSRVAIVMIESGLMYTVSIVVLFGLYMAGNNGQYGVSNAVRSRFPPSSILLLHPSWSTSSLKILWAHH